MASQITPLYLAQAQVHTFTDKCWIPLQSKVTTISILYDAGRESYRIMGIDNESQKTTVNSTIIPTLKFQKTSSNFGHWTDEKTGVIYGIGFSGTSDIDLFHESLRKAQAAVLSLPNKRPPFNTSAGTPPAAPAYKKRSDNKLRNSVLTSNPNLIHPLVNRLPPPPFPATASTTLTSTASCVLSSWSAHPDVAKLLEAAQKTEMDSKPNALNPLSNNSQFKISNPIPPVASSSTSEFEDFIKNNPVLKEPPVYHVLSDKRNKPSKSFLHGQLYPPPKYGTNAYTRNGVNATGDFCMTEESEMEDPGFMAELHRVKDENVRLKKIMIESSTNLKKWELQMDTVRSDNAVLLQKLQERSGELEELRKQHRAYEEAARKWKDSIANNAATIQALKEKEQRIQIILGENTKLRVKIKEYQEKRRQDKIRADAALQEQEMRKAVNAQQLAALESHYKEMLGKAKSPLEEIFAVTKAEQKTISEVDSLFTKAIHELITIHGEIYNGSANGGKIGGESNFSLTNNTKNMSNSSLSSNLLPPPSYQT